MSTTASAQAEQRDAPLERKVFHASEGNTHIPKKYCFQVVFPNSEPTPFSASVCHSTTEAGTSAVKGHQGTVVSEPCVPPADPAHKPPNLG